MNDESKTWKEPVAVYLKLSYGKNEENYETPVTIAGCGNSRIRNRKTVHRTAMFVGMFSKRNVDINKKKNGLLRR